MVDEGVLNRILIGEGTRQDRIRTERVKPPRYTCIHIARPELCIPGETHPRAPYRLDNVGPETLCPDCKHRGTLRKL